VKPDYKSFKDMWKKIKSGGMWYRPAHDFGNWNAIFKTPSGKFEFFSSQIEQAVRGLAKDKDTKTALKRLGLTVGLDEACMPHYEPSLSGGMGNMVMVPYEMINLSSGWVPNPPYLNKTLLDNQLLKGESFAEINPETASKYGLREGDRVLIQSDKGEIRVRVHLFDGAMPQVVYLPLGFGRSAYDDFQQGKGVNPFELFDGTEDPLSGFPIWWNTRVQLKKV
jgi:anaerobic selenocysteine-containing dehydrogenase